MRALDADVAGIALLFGTEPGDRALAGWSPAAFILVQFAGFLRECGHELPLPGRLHTLSGGPLRACSDGHEAVWWSGDPGCWCCAEGDSGRAAG